MQRIQAVGFKAASTGFWVSVGASYACALSLPVGLALTEVIAPALGYKVVGESGILKYRGAQVSSPTLGESLLIRGGYMPWFTFGLFYTIPPAVVCQIAMFALKARV